MAIAVFLLSIIIASAAALSSALTGGSLLAIVSAFLISAWVSSIFLAALMATRSALPAADAGEEDHRPITA